MIPLALGLAAAGALFWAAGAFGRARVGDLKALVGWVLALAGLSLFAMLLLTGRGAVAMSGLVLLGPLAWSWWAERRRGGGHRRAGRAGTPKMGRGEALEVLGLVEGASDSDIRAAWVRLMRSAHPDGGGTDWLASRVNQARDVLLKR